jgi:hypothetical protein
MMFGRHRLGFARRAVCSPSASRLRSTCKFCTPSGAEVDTVIISTSRISTSRISTSLISASLDEQYGVHRAEPRWTPLSSQPNASRPRSSRLRSMSSMVYTERSRGGGLCNSTEYLKVGDHLTYPNMISKILCASQYHLQCNGVDELGTTLESGSFIYILSQESRPIQNGNFIIRE